MPTGPPPAGHDGGILVRLTGRGGRGRTGPPRSGGRYGLLLAVLIATYLLSAFNGKNLATESQIGLLAAVLLLALRTAPQPSPARPGPRRRRRLPEDVDGPGDDEDRD